MGSRKPSVSLVFVLLILVISACTPGKPAVVISSPPSGSQYHEGDEVAIQSSSVDAQAVTRVELTIDGAIVRNDVPPSPQTNFTLIQTWKATQGSHTIAVRAYNAAGVASDPAAILVSVSVAAASASAPTATSTPTPTIAQPPAPLSPTPSPSTSAPATCTNNAAFVADVSVPDGTVFAAGTTFVKTWRLSNNGTCAWGAGYQFVFISGEAMTAGTVVAVPVKNPGETADISVAMNAPAAAGNHTGTWRMRSPSSAVFGQSVTVKIVVPGAPPAPPPATGCSGTPNIESFTASATTINGGQSTMLNWGAVTGADSVEIDNGIGGVPAPGSATVSPAATTTYTMIAHCGSNTKTAQVTINVQVLAPPIAAVTTTRNMTGGNENGTVYEAAASLPVVNGSMLAGDTSTNRLARAYMSFSIADLAGKTVMSASLDLTGCSQAHDPFTGNLAGIWVGELQFPLPLDQSDYNLPGTGIVRLYAKPTSAIDVKSYVQSRVSEGKSRFQIRLHPAGPSDNDGAADYLLCGAPKLTITYIP